SIEPPLVRKIYFVSHMEEGPLLHSFDDER
ncbi:LysR family transcriptional regulator, partial [Bacillus anthracis]